MGKVASDKCHKWVFKEPTECEPNISNYWQSSFDAVCNQTHMFLFSPQFHTSIIGQSISSKKLLVKVHKEELAPLCAQMVSIKH